MADIRSTMGASRSTERFPLFARAGRDAAALWPHAKGVPMSASEFRDLRLRNFLAGFGTLDAASRTQAFNDAFALEIASQQLTR
jgi:hypothetical protein